MPEMHLKLTEDYGLVPVNDEGIKYLYRRTPGDVFKCKVSQDRHYKFHQKAITLVKAMHEVLPDPEPVMFRGQLIHPIRTFNDTRKYLTILSGEFDVIGLPNGKVKLEARSWKFEKMTQDNFDVFYKNLIDACLKALPVTWDQEEIERVSRHILGYV